MIQVNEFVSNSSSPHRAFPSFVLPLHQSTMIGNNDGNGGGALDGNVNGTTFINHQNQQQKVFSTTSNHTANGQQFCSPHLPTSNKNASPPTTAATFLLWSVPPGQNGLAQMASTPIQNSNFGHNFYPLTSENGEGVNELNKNSSQLDQRINGNGNYLFSPIVQPQSYQNGENSTPLANTNHSLDSSSTSSSSIPSQFIRSAQNIHYDQMSSYNRLSSVAASIATSYASQLQ